MTDKTKFFASELGTIITHVLKRMASDKSKVSPMIIAAYLEQNSDFTSLVSSSMQAGDKSDLLRFIVPLNGFVPESGLKTVEDMVFDSSKTHEETTNALIRALTDHLLSLEKKQHRVTNFIDDIFTKFAGLQSELTNSFGSNIQFVEKDLDMDKKLLNEARDMHTILKNEDSIEYLKSRMLDSFSSFVSTFGQKTENKQGHLGEIVKDYSAVNDELEQYKKQVSQLKQDLNKYKNESVQDHLTGLFNRKYMDIKLGEVIDSSARTGAPFSIVMADIDKFKCVNDTYGHQVGDQVLKHFSKVIKDNIRKTDFAFRYGGEEFIIILVSADIRNAVHVAEQVRKKMESTNFSLKDMSFNVTASFGIAAYEPGETADTLIAVADKRLYTAKETGRNRIISQ